MATRRTKEEISADKIIKKHLLELGEKIYEQATEDSRVAKDTYYKSGKLQRAGGSLRDSQNYRVEKDTSLVMAQVYYGAFNYPKGTNSGQKNALLIAVEENVSDTTAIIIRDINDQLLKPFKK